MELTKSQLKSNIMKFYLYKSLNGMFFAVPIMVLFWQDNGLNLTEIMTLQSIFALLIVLLELPSGYFSDIFGRKRTLLISAIVGFFALVTYSIGHNFFHFLIAELLFAIHLSFMSGTDSAFLFETLSNLEMDKKYKEIWGRSLFNSMVLLAIANIIGGFIAKYNLRYPLILTLPFFLINIFVVLSFREPSSTKLIISKGNIKELMNILKFSLIDNPKLRWIILLSGFIYAMNQSVLWFYQPYFKLSGIDISHFGLVFAMFHIVSGFTAKYSHRIENKLGAKKSLILLICIISISYISMSQFVYYFSFLFCFLQQMVRGFKKTVLTDYINRLVSSEIRATVLSIDNLIAKLIYSMIIPIWGYIADVYNLRLTLLIMGLTTLLLGSISLIIIRSIYKNVDPKTV